MINFPPLFVQIIVFLICGHLPLFVEDDVYSLNVWMYLKLFHSSVCSSGFIETCTGNWLWAYCQNNIINQIINIANNIWARTQDLLLIIHVQKCLINAQTDISRWTRDLISGPRL